MIEESTCLDDRIKNKISEYQKTRKVEQQKIADMVSRAVLTVEKSNCNCSTNKSAIESLLSASDLSSAEDEEEEA